MKFYKAPYAVTKGYAQVLNSRLQALEEKNPTKTFLLTYVGNSELVSNEYSDVFRASVTLDDLFIWWIYQVLKLYFCFFLPTPLKLHGDVEIYASGRRKDYVAM